MKRDLHELEHRSHDVIVVGGGIHGACIARDAALRGLSVALVEQNDFCSATSHNSLKTIHGGIRYLQHLNFKRALESIREQQIFLKTAPHLVTPLRFLMPTYGYGMRGPFVMAAAIGLFELLSMIRLAQDEKQFRWPKGRFISASGCQKIVPGIDTDKLTGGAIWADAQVAYADKAVLQILKHAVDHGAIVANYVAAESLVKQSEELTFVSGVRARDKRTGRAFTISAPMVVNATGPWVGSWINDVLVPKQSLRVGLVKSMNLVTNRPAASMAVSFKSERESDSKVDTAKRLFFSVPWLGKAVIGTTHFTHSDSDLDVSVQPNEIDQFIEEFNRADPEMALSIEDILYCYQGLTPGDDSSDLDGAKLHESKVIDHQAVDGVTGLYSVISIKWTTARLVAEKTVDGIIKQRGEKRACKTRQQKIPDYANMPHHAAGLTDDALREFTLTHVRNTQASSLSDVVLRRTNDLVLGSLSIKQICVVAEFLATHFEWTNDEKEENVKQLLNSGLSPLVKRSLASELMGVAE